MDKVFEEMTIERDRLELSVGDALDVKAGVLLTVIAVLGTLSGIFLSVSTLGRWWQLAQFISILCLAIGCAIAVLVVIPRRYDLAGLPEAYQKWANDLSSYHDSQEKRNDAVSAGIIQQATKRITKNHAINKRKSMLLACSFWPAMVALGVDMATLIAIGYTKVLF